MGTKVADPAYGGQGGFATREPAAISSFSIFQKAAVMMGRSFALKLPRTLHRISAQALPRHGVRLSKSAETLLGVAATQCSKPQPCIASWLYSFCQNVDKTYSCTLTVKMMAFSADMVCRDTSGFSTNCKVCLKDNMPGYQFAWSPGMACICLVLVSFLCNVFSDVAVGATVDTATCVSVQAVV